MESKSLAMDTLELVDKLYARIAELERKLAVATECIAWYAEPSHYDDLEHLKGAHLPDIDRDYGQRARAALEEIK